MMTSGRISKFRSMARRFACDEDGSTAIEYGLIVALIFIAILAAVNNFSAANNNMYAKVVNGLTP
jgi:pilus assembly protein Flp/PilA